MFGRRVKARWLWTRLYGLLRSDTTAAKLFAEDHRLTPTQAPARRSMTPTQVGDLLAAWAGGGRR